MTVQIDGKKDSEKEISNILDIIVPNTNSIPTFVLFSKDKKIKYTGSGRSAQDFINFVNQNM
jgi:hypothetical protein